MHGYPIRLFFINPSKIIFGCMLIDLGECLVWWSCTYGSLPMGIISCYTDLHDEHNNQHVKVWIPLRIEYTLPNLPMLKADLGIGDPSHSLQGNLVAGVLGAW